MKYKTWKAEVPSEITSDAVWSVKVYRIALFLADLCWEDIKPIINQRLSSLSDQLYRSLGSISANITEGYSRSSHKDQARFYEIALGSTREAKDWYFKSRHILGDELATHRIKILTSITKLLLVMVKERRSANQVKEPKAEYNISLEELLEKTPTSR
ncbi:MAG: four helix bundle protein [Balneolaceae bacterium]|nr:four helix bundle protein [Balneolaceae bacterium]